VARRDRLRTCSAPPGHPPHRSSDPVPIRDLLSGGNPRTLHNVDEVTKTILADPGRLHELVRCVLDGHDEIARMRSGDALEKVCRAQPWLVQPYVPLLLGELAKIHQPSVQWHMAQMLGHVRLTAPQRHLAVRLMNKNLDESTDWIVLNRSLDTLAILARADPAVVDDLRVQLGHHEQSSHKSSTWTCSYSPAPSKKQEPPSHRSPANHRRGPRPKAPPPVLVGNHARQRCQLVPSTRQRCAASQ